MFCNDIAAIKNFLSVCRAGGTALCCGSRNKKSRTEDAAPDGMFYEKIFCGRARRKCGRFEPRVGAFVLCAEDIHGSSESGIFSIIAERRRAVKHCCLKAAQSVGKLKNHCTLNLNML